MWFGGKRLARDLRERGKEGGAEEAKSFLLRGYGEELRPRLTLRAGFARQASCLGRLGTVPHGLTCGELELHPATQVRAARSSGTRNDDIRADKTPSHYARATVKTPTLERRLNEET